MNPLAPSVKPISELVSRIRGSIARHSTFPESINMVGDEWV